MSQHASSDSLRHRIGMDLGNRVPLTDGVEWAADNDVKYVEFRIDHRLDGQNPITDEEIATVAKYREEHGVQIGLHSQSAVNVAATEPFLRDAADRYLEAYVDMAARLDAVRVVFHGGYHFTDDHEERKSASIDRLTRVGELAVENDVSIVICNMNPEPADGEIQYLCDSIEECIEYSDRLPTDAVKWAFNAPHAHLRPEGIEGFLDQLDIDRIGLVRLNDNNGVKEEHIPPGEGNIDFEMIFDRLEGAGYSDHYSLAFGDQQAKLDGREYLLNLV